MLLSVRGSRLSSLVMLAGVYVLLLEAPLPCIHHDRVFSNLKDILFVVRNLFLGDICSSSPVRSKIASSLLTCLFVTCFW